MPQGVDCGSLRLYARRATDLLELREEVDLLAPLAVGGNPTVAPALSVLFEEHLPQGGGDRDHPARQSWAASSPLPG